jgi:hypothetical protein
VFWSTSQWFGPDCVGSNQMATHSQPKFHGEFSADQMLALMTPFRAVKSRFVLHCSQFSSARTTSSLFSALLWVFCPKRNCH